MKNLRKYGQPPFSTAVIHGGPGAPGTMAPVARELSGEMGVLEPLQTSASLEGQLWELKAVLEEYGDLPINLVGHSWGAMLGFIFSARFPSLIKKVILVGSGGFEEKYAAGIMEIRLNRLSEEDSREVLSLMKLLDNPAAADKNPILSRFGYLCMKADTYNPMNLHTEALECQFHIHRKVWDDALKLRAGGKLLVLGKRIRCPVTAIHGGYDPHPCAGVQKPLSSVLKDFKFILLKNCGHYPWLEREVREEFFKILKKELLL